MLRPTFAFPVTSTVTFTAAPYAHTWASPSQRVHRSMVSHLQAWTRTPLSPTPTAPTNHRHLRSPQSQVDADPASRIRIPCPDIGRRLGQEVRRSSRSRRGQGRERERGRKVGCSNLSSCFPERLDFSTDSMYYHGIIIIKNIFNVNNRPPSCLGREEPQLITLTS
jgi:hypothetical protein